MTPIPTTTATSATRRTLRAVVPAEDELRGAVDE